VSCCLLLSVLGIPDKWVVLLVRELFQNPLSGRYNVSHAVRFLRERVCTRLFAVSFVLINIVVCNACMPSVPSWGITVCRAPKCCLLVPIVCGINGTSCYSFGCGLLRPAGTPGCLGIQLHGLRNCSYPTIVSGGSLGG